MRDPMRADHRPRALRESQVQSSELATKAAPGVPNQVSQAGEVQGASAGSLPFTVHLALLVIGGLVPPLIGMVGARWCLTVLLTRKMGLTGDVTNPST